MKTSTRYGLASVAMMLALLLAPMSFARTTACPLDQSIAEKNLPRQGQETLSLIAAGGPFSSDRDGIAFNNRERLLPREKRGYYREYTVRTPGVRSRGARRIVCGGDQRAADQCYYSDDHYQSFKCIAR